MPPVNDLNNLKTQVAKDNQKQLASKIRRRVGFAAFIVVGVFATIAAGAFGLGVGGILVGAAIASSASVIYTMNEIDIRKSEKFDEKLEIVGNEMQNETAQSKNEKIQTDNKVNNDDIELENTSKKTNEKKNPIIKKIYEMKEEYLGPNRKNNFNDMKKDRNNLAALVQMQNANKVKLSSEEIKIFKDLENEYSFIKNEYKKNTKKIEKNLKKSEKIKQIETEKEIDTLYQTVNNFINKPDKNKDINIYSILSKLDSLIGNSGDDKNRSSNRNSSLEAFENQNISFVSRAKLDSSVKKIKAMIIGAKIVEKEENHQEPTIPQKNTLKMK